MRPFLPLLVPPLLESLSSLEDARLNYIEQHAGRLGLDNEKLEGARVSASRASPMADALDLAARYTVSKRTVYRLLPVFMFRFKVRCK